MIVVSKVRHTEAVNRRLPSFAILDQSRRLRILVCAQNAIASRLSEVLGELTHVLCVCCAENVIEVVCEVYIRDERDEWFIAMLLYTSSVSSWVPHHQLAHKRTSDWR